MLTIRQVLVSLVLSSFCIFLTGCIDLAAPPPRPLHTAHYKTGNVYAMRGGLGGIFSKGMNRLENTLNEQYKVKTDSIIWYKTNQLSNSIIAQYKNKTVHGPIILIGHSLGANEQIKVAKNLYKAHIPVDLLITVDAVAPIKIPPNVKYAVNLYKPAYVPLFSGLKVEAEDPEFTYVNNLDVSKIKDVSVNHFTIDKNDKIQEIMLKNVLAVIDKKDKKSVS